MNFIGNILWLILGGFIISLEYFIASILLIVTIIGIPFGVQTLKLANLSLWPFGRDAMYIHQPPGCFSTLLNVIWLILGGFWISITHLCLGILLTLTIIGLPFGMQHFKLAVLALMPFGKTVSYYR